MSKETKSTKVNRSDFEEEANRVNLVVLEKLIATKDDMNLYTAQALEKLNNNICNIYYRHTSNFFSKADKQMHLNFISETFKANNASGRI